MQQCFSGGYIDYSFPEYSLLMVSMLFFDFLAIFFSLLENYLALLEGCFSVIEICIYVPVDHKVSRSSCLASGLIHCDPLNIFLVVIEFLFGQWSNDDGLANA